MHRNLCLVVGKSIVILLFISLYSYFSGVSAFAETPSDDTMNLYGNPLQFRGSAPSSSWNPGQDELSCEEETAPKEGESEEDFRFRLFLKRMLRGEPIETMVPFIAKRDRETAAFLVAIARKESSWGEHAPSKDGIDCFNYWGYKGTGSRGVGMGHACFGSPEEAVEIVGNRITTLVHEKKLNSPERLIVWKCGRSCEGHDPASVAKWISDVRFIYTRVLPKG